MSKPKYIFHALLALFVLALALRAITSNSVTLRIWISPAAVEFHAEGSQK